MVICGGSFGFAAIGNDLFQPAVEPVEGFRELLARRLVASLAVVIRSIALAYVLDLASQRVEAGGDGGEILAARVMFMFIIAGWVASEAHDFVSLYE